MDDEQPFAVKPPTPEGMAGWLRAGVRSVQQKLRGWFNTPVVNARRRAHEEAFFRLMEEAQARSVRENLRVPLHSRRAGRGIPIDIAADIAFVKNAPSAEAELPKAFVPARQEPPPEPNKRPPVVEVARSPVPEPKPAPIIEAPDAVAPAPILVPPARVNPSRDAVKTVAAVSSATFSAARSASRWLYGDACAAARFAVVLWHKFWFGCLMLPGPVRRIVRPAIRFGMVAWPRIVNLFEPHGEILRAAVPFQPDLDEIIEEPPPPAMRGTYYFMLALVVVLLLITSLFEVEIVVTGAGQISADAPPVVLQPMERAIIREVRVKVGDAVKKGDLLARLDPTFAQADMETLSVQNATLRAQVTRIEAEIDGRPFNIASSANAADVLQVAVYNQRQAQYASHLQAYDEEVQRLEANIRATEEERAFLAMQLNIASEVEGMRTQLWQGRLTSKLQYLESQSNRLRSARDHQGAVDRLIEQRHSLQGKRAERQAFIDDWRRQLMEELASRRTEMSKVSESLAKAARMRDLVTLKAPEDGVVLDVAKRSVGSVMREAEPLITLVPSGAPLIGEIVIGSSDVGYVAPGNDVVIKVDAFPYQRHGMLKGRLLSISEESYSPGAARGADGASGPSMSGAYHRARVALVDIKLVDLPEGGRLIPGMTLSAEIQVGKRSVISYILNPITRGLRESMREP